MMIKILCILSKLLNGNPDLIEMIYKKKILIEKNETILYYLFNGLENDMLYSYSIFTINVKGDSKKYEYFLTDGPEKPMDFIHEVTGKDRIDQFNTGEVMHNGFINSFMINKVHDSWKCYSEKELKKDKKFAIKTLLKCMTMEGFIKVKGFNGFGAAGAGDPFTFREANIKEKTRALNYILKKHGIIYLNLIQIEYSTDGGYEAIILRENGTVESIMGAIGETS